MTASEGQAVKKFNCVEDVWDFLIEFELFTEAELQLVTNVAGYSVDTLNDCIYSKFGYHDIEQFIKCEGLAAEKEFWGVAQNE